MPEKNLLKEIFIKNHLPHYISEYLTHWTGKDKSDELGFLNLKSIVESRMLLLNYCHHFSPTQNCEACLKMVSFTDIPHYLSKKHCEKYGKFGIVFNKANFKKYGANPVLYITYKNKEIAKKVYDFICNSSRNKQIDAELKSSLKSFFGYVQDYNNVYSNKDLYYEREWRILENSLDLERNGETCPGKKVTIGTQDFIRFSKDDIQFLICPTSYIQKVSKFYQSYIYPYENYVKNF